MSALREKLIAQIGQTGPMSVAQFMAAALYDPQHGYYTQAPQIGEHGDFTTAPEISQMFGELVGLWCVHEWDQMGAPGLDLIEFGPGRGTLMADIWRAAKVAPAFREQARITLIEINDKLRAAQRETLALVGASADWRGQLSDVAPGPTIIVMNEFLDCLPIRQFVRTRAGESLVWREQVIGLDDGDLSFGLTQDPHIAQADFPPVLLHDAPEGAVAEIAPGLAGWIDRIAERLLAQPGRALIIDYATDGSGDSMQAMQAHEKVDPLEAPGEVDLTARVDFDAVARLARAAGLAVHGPMGQGDFLRALGIETRAAMLTQTHPESAEMIARGLHRLTHADEMGALFQAICLSSPLLPAPAGFSV